MGGRVRRWWVRHFGSRRLADEFDRLWGDLAAYNGECHRGIVHDAATDARMAVKQEAFRRWAREQPEYAPGGESLG